MYALESQGQFNVRKEPENDPRTAENYQNFPIFKNLVTFQNPFEKISKRFD